MIVGVLEKGLKVGDWVRVVGVMVARAAAARKHAVHGQAPRQLVARVAVDRDQNDQAQPRPVDQGVNAHRDRDCHRKGRDSRQLAGVGVLRHPHKRRVVLVVYRVNMLIEQPVRSGGSNIRLAG